jgi:hypothetical protein
MVGVSHHSFLRYTVFLQILTIIQTALEVLYVKVPVRRLLNLRQMNSLFREK